MSSSKAVAKEPNQAVRSLLGSTKGMFLGMQKSGARLGSQYDVLCATKHAKQQLVQAIHFADSASQYEVLLT